MDGRSAESSEAPMNGISAYLIVYNDWDMLEQVLRSIAPVVDEIVVVDGAYEWLAPYHQAFGCALERSDERLHAVLQNCGIPFRLISGVWRSESEKRIAGYESCRHRFVCRVDADEIVFFDQAQLARFLRGGAVAQVEIPTYVAPGRVLASTRKGTLPPDQAVLPRAGFLFDGNRVPAPLHLNYLWLNIESRDKFRPLAVEHDAVGFVAHLPQWRTAENAARRAAFYLLNWARHHGLSWIPQLRDRPVPDLEQLFKFVSPCELHEIMLASKIVPNPVAPSQCIRRSPLGSGDGAQLTGCHANRLASVRNLNRLMVEKGLNFAPHIPLTIDLTDRRNFVDRDSVHIEFDTPVSSVEAQLYSVHSAPPWGRWTGLAHKISGRRVEITLSEEADSLLHDALRGHVELRIRTKCDKPVQRFRLCHDFG